MQETPERQVWSLVGEGQGNPLQYSCLENSMDRRAWPATVHRVTQSQTRLKRLSTDPHTQVEINVVASRQQHHDKLPKFLVWCLSPLSDDLDRGTVRIWCVQLIPFVSSLFSILEATPSNHGKRVSEVSRKVLNFHRLWVVDRPVCTKYVCVHGSREEVGLRSGGRRVLYIAFIIFKKITQDYVSMFISSLHSQSYWYLLSSGQQQRDGSQLILGTQGFLS